MTYMMESFNYTLKQIDILHLFWCKEKYLFGTKWHFVQCTILDFDQKIINGAKTG